MIELLGRRGGPRVELSRRTLETEPWEDRFVEDEAVAPGQQRVSQRGIRGFTVVQERTVYAQTGVRVEARRVRYPPTDRIVRVSPGALDSLTGRPSSTPVMAP